MLKFSPAGKSQTQPNESNLRKEIRLVADTFVESLKILQNDIIYRKNIVKKAKFIQSQIEANTPIIADPLLLFKQVMLEEVFDSQQSHDSLELHFNYFVRMQGGPALACGFLTKSYEGSVMEFESLLRTIKESLKDGSTLAPYLWCKQLLGAAKYRHKATIPNASSRKDFEARDADFQDKYDRILGISTLTLIFDLLHETLSAEELQFSKEINILYFLDLNTSRLDFAFDSELFAYLRGDKFLKKSKHATKNDINEIQTKTSRALDELLSLVTQNKGQMLLASVLPHDLYMKILLQINSIKEKQQQDITLAPLTILLQLYQIKDELIEFKTIFESAEVYNTPNNRGLSLIIDYDRLGTPDALRKELYDQCEILDRAKLHVVATDVESTQPSTTENLAVTQAVQPLEEEEKSEPLDEELATVDISQYSSSNKRTAAEREAIAQQRQQRRKENVLARMRSMANLGHKKFKADGSEITSDVKPIDKDTLIKQDKLSQELFSLSNNSFSRTDADTLLAAFGGIIKNRGSGGSHVSIFLPSLNSVELRFVGPTSFHSIESGCAMLESLSMLRYAIYNHLSQDAIAYLREALGKNFYEPARRQIITSASLKNKG